MWSSQYLRQSVYYAVLHPGHLGGVWTAVVQLMGRRLVRVFESSAPLVTLSVLPAPVQPYNAESGSVYKPPLGKSCVVIIPQEMV